MFQIRRLIGSVIAAAALVALPASTLAQDARVAQQLKLRQSAYTVLGAQMAAMGAMASGRAPYDAAAFRLAAERAAFMATIVPDLFPPGSAGNGKAKPELWQQQADFQKLMKDMQAKTATLATAARGNDLEAIKPVFGAAGASCKACHDKYKAD